MKAVVCVLLLVVVVGVFGDKAVHDVVEKKSVSYSAGPVHAAAAVVHTVTQKAYLGTYGGSCGKDGFYIKDDVSFVICSNGNAYVQRCAPGSKNSGKYTSGKYYAQTDFCDVNLVDHGYGVKHGYAAPAPVPVPAYGHAQPAYYGAAYPAGHAYAGYGPVNFGYAAGPAYGFRHWH